MDGCRTKVEWPPNENWTQVRQTLTMTVGDTTVGNTAAGNYNSRQHDIADRPRALQQWHANFYFFFSSCLTLHLAL
jgi:hypothetical protein